MKHRGRKRRSSARSSLGSVVCPLVRIPSSYVRIPATPPVLARMGADVEGSRMKVGTISRFVLAHKLLVVVFWAVVTVVAATVSSSVGALSQDFSVPGREGARDQPGDPGDPRQRRLQRAKTGGVVTLPEGTTVDSPGVMDELNALFAELRRRPRAPGWRPSSPPATAPSSRTTVARPSGSTPSRSSRVSATHRRRSRSGRRWPGRRSRARRSTSAVTTSCRPAARATTAPASWSKTLTGGLGALLVLTWVFGSFLALVPS